MYHIYIFFKCTHVNRQYNHYIVLTTIAKGWSVYFSPNTNLVPVLVKAEESLNLVPQELKHRLTDFPLQDQGRKEEL